MKCLVYIDYENMNDLKELEPIDGQYLIFLGSNQKNVPKKLVLSTTGHQVDWIEIKGSGKNALDFHIAYYLSKNDTDKSRSHFILSKDKGFDSLVKHINKKANSEIVKRIISLSDIRSEGKTYETATKKLKGLPVKYDKVRKNIDAIQKSKRPQSEKKLHAHIFTLSGNEKWQENEIRIIIEELYREGLISKGSNNRIIYSE